MSKMFLKMSLGLVAAFGLTLLGQAAAPLAPWGSNLAVMNGSNPNGGWSLFVQDDKPFDAGVISNGWYITLTTASPVGYAADNQLSVTPASLSITTNKNWPVTLTVTNYGPSSSTNVYVTDTLPGSGVTLVSSNATSGTTVAIVGSTLTWTVGLLTNNAGASLTLNFLATAAGTYNNNAQVYAVTSDPNPDDDVGAAMLLVGVPTPPVLVPHYNSGGSGGFQLTVTGTSASTLIQASTNLINWVPVYTNIPTFTYTNYDTTNYMRRFYRAVVGP
jgi:uncharacterized repeat protein (TIGR01451 family)